MDDDKIKTNKYTVYMIKPEIQSVEDIVATHGEPLEIEGVGSFVFDESFPRPPEWVKNFFGNALGEDIRILTSSAKGVLVVPVKKKRKTVYFVVSFGFGRHLLKDGVVEERFGLKVVLNSLDQSNFRSIDKTVLGSIPKHSREQMSRDVNAFDFGIDIEQDLISSVTGKSKDIVLGNIITGKDSLSGSAKIDVTNIKDFLSHCLERYKSNDYKTNFGWIDQIAEIRDKILEEELSILLAEKIKNDELGKIWLAVPEVVNWSDVKGFRYLRAKHGGLYDDLNIEDFKTEAGTPITLDLLKSSYVHMISAATDEPIEHWSVFRCMYSEIELRNETFILNNGKWYKIATGFVEQVKNEFSQIPRSTIPLPDCTVTNEGEYNTYASASLTNSCCMDCQLISHGGGHSSIEFCDIFTGDKKMIHVKRYGGSSVLSHLFSQGAVSGELFVSDRDFRQKVNDKLPNTHKLADATVRPNTRDYEIVYGIISESSKPLDIPFFSKVSMKNANRRLMNFGYNVSLKQIKKITSPASSSNISEVVVEN